MKIVECLDRFLVSQNWSLLSISLKLEILPLVRFDHYAISPEILDLIHSIVVNLQV